MKKIFLPILLVAAYSTANAQIPFSTIDSIDINNINASILVHGDMWWNPATESAHSYFPKHSAASINFTSALWMSGYDAGNNLHIAAQTYRQTGNDYWPGPLDSGDTLTYTTSHAWAKIWKVNRTDIQYFQSLSTHTTTNTPNAILTWPGKGNTYAQGNAGTSLTITTDMAPFVDVNSNGVYEPLLGDYPDIKGDQALWWVFSDNGPAHGQTNGKPLGVEIHAMAYAYSRGTLIDNVVYYEYYITNKSANNYHNFRFGQWDDIDLGYFQDDYLAFDSSLRMGIDYNGTNDDGGLAGHPTNSYGLNPPQSALTMIVLPGDAGSTYVPAGSFMYFNNDFSTIGNPTADTEYNYYLRASNRIGQHLKTDTSGYNFTTGTNTNYVYESSAADTAQPWECRKSDNPGDRRFIIASNDFTFNAGSTQHIVFAQVAADSAGGCPDASFTKIRTVADTAWHIYHNPLPVLPTNVTNVQYNGDIKIYPNPAHDKLFIENSGSTTGEETMTVYNTLGQTMNVMVSGNGRKNEINVSTLPAGVYYILYKNNNEQMTAKFLKD